MSEETISQNDLLKMIQQDPIQLYKTGKQLCITFRIAHPGGGAWKYNRSRCSHCKQMIDGKHIVAHIYNENGPPNYKHKSYHLNTCFGSGLGAYITEMQKSINNIYTFCDKYDIPLENT